VAYTANTIESESMSLGKIADNHGLFPCDEALLKLVYPVLRKISKKWAMQIMTGGGTDALYDQPQRPAVTAVIPVTQDSAHPWVMTGQGPAKNC
jgi:hypothetical protein